MKETLLKEYYKAAAWPPFYVISIPTVIVLTLRYLSDPETFSVTGLNNYLVLVSFYSGLIAISCAGLFLCTIKRIARNFYYSLLSWFLLPVSIIAYIFLVVVDVSSINRPKDPEMLLVAIMAAVIMFHVIGLIISFNAFRASMILQMREEKRNPVLKEIQVTELKSMEETTS